MKPILAPWSLRLASLSLAVCIWSTLDRTGAEEPKKNGPPSAAPVEDDMHEFMEYVFEPAYQRLKSRMTAAPADTGAWKAVKSDSLILAESSNLLLHRGDDTDRKSWDALAVEVRDAGGQLYQSAKKKDAKTARQHYETLISKCNACHQKFAGGEHQLEP